MRTFVRDHTRLREKTFMSLTLWLPIVAGVLAVLYGVVTTQRLMAMSQGNAKMQEIAKAIQEGANAYLNRQYRTPFR